MSKLGTNADPDEFDGFDQDDDIEILEVVGLDESPSEAPGRSPLADVDPDDVVVDLGEEPRRAGSGVMESGQEQLLRLRADFDNYRKRVAREREAAERHASTNLVMRLLPVLDNFERALWTQRDLPADQNFQHGVALIFRQLLEELRKEGLTAVDSVGEHFDPEVHEAVATTDDSPFPPHTVVEELQRGYLLHERLLRPALVKVTIDPTDPAELSRKPGDRDE